MNDMHIARKEKYLYWIFIAPCLFGNIDGYAQKIISKEIQKEVTIMSTPTIQITGSLPIIQVKGWNQSKVKMVLQFNADSSLRSLNSDEWLAYWGLTMRAFNSRVDISTEKKPVWIEKPFEGKLKLDNLKFDQRSFHDPRPSQEPSPAHRPRNLFTDKVELSKDKKVGKSSQLQPDPKSVQLAEKADSKKAALKMVHASNRILTIWVPMGSQLKIINKYGDVIIGMDVGDAELEVSNGNLEAENFRLLRLTGKFCNANLGNIKKAVIDFQNGSFTAGNIDDLDLESKGSTIDYEGGNYCYMRSQSDEISIETIGKLDARKTYGSLRIEEVNGDVDFEGQNANIRFRSISPDVKQISINNKYADLRLPVKKLTNYHVDFTGYYTTVFAPFTKEVVASPAAEKEPVDSLSGPEKEKMRAMKYLQEQERLRYDKEKSKGVALGELAPRRFTGTVGNLKDKHTAFKLNCTACTVDFK